MNVNILKLKFKKYSPEILLGIGTIGTITSTVLACKATRKIDKIMNDLKTDVKKINEAKENLTNEQYSENDKMKDLVITYGQTGIKFVKLYGPSVVLGIFSLGCMFGSHNILSKRGAAMAAAYTAVNESFKAYRKRVAEKYGDEEEKDILLNRKIVKIEETVKDKKTGKTKKVKKEIKISDPMQPSPFARFFDESCYGWRKDPTHNLYELRCLQSTATDKLKEKGYLFLNEVYDMIGLPPIKEGQYIGWVYDESDPIGDNCVSFGLYDLNINPEYAKGKKNFINGYENSILLDFNIDGYIIDLIDWKQNTGKDYWSIIRDNPNITKLPPYDIDSALYDETKDFNSEEYIKEIV